MGDAAPVGEGVGGGLQRGGRDELWVGAVIRVLVCGGRKFADRDLLNRTLSDLHRTRGIDCIIEGNARGADRLAGFWARKHRIDNIKFDADWARDDKAAGPIRNQRMLDEGRPDLVVAFPGGSGTADMVRRARHAGVRVVSLTPAP